MKFLFLMIFSAIIITFCRKFIDRNIDIVNRKPGRSWLIGLLAFILLPIISLIAFLTVVAWPIGIVCIFLWIGILLMYELFATVHVTLWLEKRWKTKGTWKLVLLMTLTALFFTLVNGVDFLIVLFFMGAHLSHLFGMAKKENE